MIPRNSLGGRGEKEARKYLKKKGYIVVENNCRIGGSEIDIIAVKDDFLVFIEVKSRQSVESGSPEEFVDKRKMRKIIAGARMFSARKKYREMFIRFDIISVVFSDGKYIVDHLENAFEEHDV
ncbi:MAG: YraN family protein [Acidobacteriota bacterium]